MESVETMTAHDDEVLGKAYDVRLIRRLSKYVRLCDWVMSRPQIQEEAVTRLEEFKRRILDTELGRSSEMERIRNEFQYLIDDLNNIAMLFTGVRHFRH